MPRPEVVAKLQRLQPPRDAVDELPGGKWSHSADYFTAQINPKRLGLPDREISVPTGENDD